MSEKDTLKLFSTLGAALLLMIITALPAKAATKSTSTSRYCSCVNYARAITGKYTGHIGVARNHPINSKTPKVGSIVVLREGPVGHVAVVKGISNGMIRITEANYKRCAVTTRLLSITSPKIRGYYF